eukprot:6292048-Pyramimonas_sp.AAC.1
MRIRLWRGHVCASGSGADQDEERLRSKISEPSSETNTSKVSSKSSSENIWTLGGSTFENLRDNQVRIPSLGPRPKTIGTPRSKILDA